ncbi:RNA-binding protein [Spirochaetota bacterium]
MSKKIYVGNLNFATTENSLRELFMGFGVVEDLSIATDKANGVSKGFGFVTMSSQETAVAAIKALDGQDFEGRRLRVNAAREKPSGIA